MTSIQLVELGQLVEDPDNPRIDVGDVTSLATSIKNMGLQQALRVRPLEDGTFAVVAGSRRHAAMREAKLPADYAVPCTITTDNGSGSTLTGLVENAQRENLSRWEQADAFARLRNEFGMRQKQIAELTGFDPSLISRRIAQADLSPVAREAIDRVIEAGARYSDEDVTQLARNHADVPDEVWSVINTNADVGRMERAQAMTKLRDRIAESLSIDNPVVDDHDNIEVPTGHRLVEHQDRSANDADEVDVHPGDTGVMRRYFSWVPFTIEEIPAAEVEKAKDERAQERELQRAARERSTKARQLWHEQWVHVVEQLTVAQAKQMVLDWFVRAAAKEWTRHPFDTTTLDRLKEACGWVVPEDTSCRQYATDLLSAQGGWRVAALSIILDVPVTLTGDPSATTLPEWLDELRKEHKVKVPRVKEA